VSNKEFEGYYVKDFSPRPIITNFSNMQYLSHIKLSYKFLFTSNFDTLYIYIYIYDIVRNHEDATKHMVRSRDLTIFLFEIPYVFNISSK